jgi:hypothetical protein
MLMDTPRALRLADSLAMGVMIYESDGTLAANSAFGEYLVP